MVTLLEYSFRTEPRQSNTGPLHRAHLVRRVAGLIVIIVVEVALPDDPSDGSGVTRWCDVNCASGN